MAISFVGAQGNTGTTVTIPTHQSGDLILLFAYKDGSSTSITTPTAGGTVPTWISINFGGVSFNSTNFRYAVATGSNTTSGTWTTATEVFCLVYRGTKAIGASAAANNTTNVISYPALTLNRTDGTSWVVGVAGHRSATNVEQAPSGMTNRVSSGTEAAGHDTNGTAFSWSAQTVTVNASSGWRSVTVELRDASLSLSCDAGSYALGGQNATLTKGAAVNNYTLTGAAGSCVLTGQVADLRLARQLAGAAGSAAFTGQEAGLTTTRLVIAVAGAAAVTGQVAQLRNARVAVGAVGSFSLTGQAATLNKGGASQSYTLTAAAGAVTTTGHPAGLTTGRKVGGGAGAVGLTGQAASLDFAGLLSYTILGAAGALATAGQPAGLRRGFLPLDAAAGALSVIGQAAGYGYGRKLGGAVGPFALAGRQAMPKAARLLVSASTGYSAAGQASTLTKTERRRVVIFI